MSTKKYRIWTTPKDGSSNGRWDRCSPIYKDREECERIALSWTEMSCNKHMQGTIDELYEVREYTQGNKP